MAENNPNLIPPPSIGESKASVAAAAAGQAPKKSKLWIVVLLCVLVGVGAGVVVYQQSIVPTPRVSPRPSVQPTPTPTPTTPQVSQVTPQSNQITMPKAGEVRVYLSSFDLSNPAMPNQYIRVTTSNGQADIIAPATLGSGDSMHIFDTGIEVAAGQAITLEVFDGGDETRPGYGWIPPSGNNQCGSSAKADASPFVTWATGESAGEQLVAIQCWGDWGAPGDPSNTDFNDYLVIVSYAPTLGASPAASAQASTAASASPSTTATSSPSTSPLLSISPSPSPSSSTTLTTSPSPTATTTTTLTTSPLPSTSSSTVVTSTSTSPSPRAAVSEASELPDAGVFEVTVGTVGVGLLLILLGALGLLVL